MKLTIRTVSTIKPDPQRDIYIWDDEVAGFGLRVKPSGVYSFCLQYRNASGRSRRITLCKLGIKTPEEARKLALKRLSEVADGKDPAEAKTEKRKAMTVKQLCEDYLKAAEKGLILGKRKRPKKQSTLYTDKGRIERHILPLLGNKKVRDLTTPDITGFISSVTQGKTAIDIKTGFRGRAIVKGGSGTASRTVGLLGGILSYAVSQGIIPSNPVRGVSLQSGHNRKIRLSAEQYKELGDTLVKAEKVGENKKAIAAIKLLVLTGCRRGEIEKLRWDEVDIAGHCLRLSDSKEGESIRPLGMAAIDVLNELQKAKDKKKAAENKDTKNPQNAFNPYVLQGKENKNYVGLPKAWLRIRKLGELPAELTPHGFRHAFASVAGDHYYTEPTIKAMIGHSAQTVTERYIHHLDDALIEAADRVSKYISDAMCGKIKKAKVLNMPRKQRRRK